MMSITLVTAAFGGWLTARLAEDHLLGHALMMATLALVSAVFVGAIRWASTPLWYHVVSWTLMPVAAAIGALAWKRTLLRLRPELARRAVAS